MKLTLHADHLFASTLSYRNGHWKRWLEFEKSGVQQCDLNNWQLKYLQQTPIPKIGCLWPSLQVQNEKGQWLSFYLISDYDEQNKVIWDVGSNGMLKLLLFMHTHCYYSGDSYIQWICVRVSPLKVCDISWFLHCWLWFCLICSLVYGHYFCFLFKFRKRCYSSLCL